MYLEIVILVLMGCALWTVWAADLLKSAIGLAVTSVVLAIIMFRMAAPLAAVFELSVCAGLITVVFISVISLTRPGTKTASVEKRNRLSYIFLPAVIMSAGLVFALLKYHPEISSLLTQAPAGDMRRVLWGERQLDLFGQVVVLLAGIFGVVVLFKERGKHG